MKNIRAHRYTAAFAACAALLLGLAGPVSAQADDNEGPYWVSTSKDKANMRVGPGRDYRISWTYTRKGVPLKALRVMGGWRLVEDKDGSRGWILAQFLTRERAGIVDGSITGIRANKDGSGRILWRVAPGVIGKLGECAAGWCGFDIDGRKGFIRADSVWGAQKP
ncbi:SH3 domain-containing protein [Novosphingobium sp. MMS21-SN21R]|uniref:SH3 domain-containing protein n=1 Tax=Novosphingobium sp. MMS21-SN21R TaxID=2969298 RepID=UPI002887F50C|nr:SH3 domain-containing protein [Novosphingobium sp. MMS21-SN21R]MDT0507773.1 SH3 domain-containing protein [Novosphingobium sp. MMS21-SN21R]